MSTAPTLYQYRVLPVGEFGPWSQWIPCTKAKAEECLHTLVHTEWQYEVRELYAESPDKAVEAFKEALHEHFNEFPIPSKLGVVAIMKHIEKVFKEHTK